MTSFPWFACLMSPSRTNTPSKWIINSRAESTNASSLEASCNWVAWDIQHQLRGNPLSNHFGSILQSWLSLDTIFEASNCKSNQIQELEHDYSPPIPVCMACLFLLEFDRLRKFPFLIILFHEFQWNLTASSIKWLHHLAEFELSILKTKWSHFFFISC